jgi:hypothetical protein
MSLGAVSYTDTSMSLIGYEIPFQSNFAAWLAPQTGRKPAREASFGSLGGAWSSLRLGLRLKWGEAHEY